LRVFILDVTVTGCVICVRREVYGNVHYKPYGFFLKDFVPKLIYVEKIELSL
jgi:hypothetical protein